MSVQRHGDAAAPNYRHFSSFAAFARLPVRKCRKIHWKKRSSVNTSERHHVDHVSVLRAPWNRWHPHETRVIRQYKTRNSVSWHSLISLIKI